MLVAILVTAYFIKYINKCLFQYFEACNRPAFILVSLGERRSVVDGRLDALMSNMAIFRVIGCCPGMQSHSICITTVRRYRYLHGNGTTAAAAAAAAAVRLQLSNSHIADWSILLS